MATLSISTALAKEITDSLTYRNAGDSAYEYYTGGISGSDFGYITNTRASRANGGDNNPNWGTLLGKYSGQGSSYSGAVSLTGLTVAFRNSSNTTLTSYATTEIVSRAMDSDGYCVLSNFPEKTPSNAGTIDYIYISGNTGREITLTVGTTGSGADVEFVDRTLVTTQPWRLDGVIKFRIPLAFTYTT